MSVNYLLQTGFQYLRPFAKKIKHTISMVTQLKSSCISVVILPTVCWHWRNLAEIVSQREVFLPRVYSEYEVMKVFIETVSATGQKQHFL